MQDIQFRWAKRPAVINNNTVIEKVLQYRSWQIKRHAIGQLESWSEWETVVDEDVWVSQL
jgi:hypothetical protein